MTTSSSGRISTQSPTRAFGTGTTGRPGLIDTSVAIRLETAELRCLSTALATSALTIAELVAGPLAAGHDLERQQRRRHRLRWIEASTEVLHFDLRCAHAYAQIYENVRRVGRKPRGSRTVDLLIAATALAHDLPLYTLNAKDLRGLDDLIKIVDLSAKVGQ